MIKKILFAVLLLSGTLGFSQAKYTISGYIKDSKTGEEIIGATFTIKEIPSAGAATNAYGFYSITIPSGKYTVTAQYIGYEMKVMELDLAQNKRLDILLLPKAVELKEAEITVTKPNDNITKTEMGVEKLDIQEIKNIPVLMGEKDVIKTLQLLPGIKSAGEGNSGFYVRGGAADENLILLDEATVYSASHLLGFFSVFNSDAIKDVTVYKGGSPAEYGGRLSSVLDIKMNDGNDKKYGVSGGIGLISSRLNVEGPIVKDKGSFSLSGRRTYADLFLKLAPDTSLRKARLFFYDTNLKANYRINDKNRIFLSGYFGKDVLGFGKAFGVDWGNTTGTIRWNHLISSKMFSNTSLIFSNYDYKINFGSDNGAINIISRIQDYNLKQDFQYFPGSISKIKFGFDFIYHRMIPGVISSTSSSTFTEFKLSNKFATENAVYFSHDLKISAKIGLQYGLRLTAFSMLGPGDFFNYDANGEVTDSTHYASGKIVKNYFNPEPRLSTSYMINEKNSIKASYARNVQNMHLLSNSTSGNPLDLWVPSSNNIKPRLSDQVSLGYFRNLKENTYEASVEVYYKNLQHEVDYKDGAQLIFNERVESQLLYGNGRAYGAEFFLKKKYGRFNGWIGYTISRAEKKIVGINNDQYYAEKQDRTHDVSVVGIFEATKKWTFSATWVYYTGNAVTFPSGKYEVAGQIVNYYTERNGYRMPAYHRGDIGATWQRKKTEKFESSWTFSVYNVYNRANAYSIDFQQSKTDPTKTEAVQTTLFKIIPAITYNFKF